MIRRAFLQMLGFSPLAAVLPKKEHESFHPDCYGRDSSQKDGLIAWYHQMHQNQLQATQFANKRAFDTLEVAGFKQSELEQVRKDICKRMPSVSEHYNRFSCYFWERTGFTDEPPMQDVLELWIAILVTFRTGQDGFFTLGIKPLSKEV
jgi:hypothetical protein